MHSILRHLPWYTYKHNTWSSGHFPWYCHIVSNGTIIFKAQKTTPHTFCQLANHWSFCSKKMSTHNWPHTLSKNFMWGIYLKRGLTCGCGRFGGNHNHFKAIDSSTPPLWWSSWESRQDKHGVINPHCAWTRGLVVTLSVCLSVVHQAFLMTANF